MMLQLTWLDLPHSCWKEDYLTKSHVKLQKIVFFEIQPWSSKSLYLKAIQAILINHYKLVEEYCYKFSQTLSLHELWYDH